MFDNFKGMAALAGVLKDLPRVKARLQEVKIRLSETTVEGSAGGGAVIVIATGSLRIVDIRCDSRLLSMMVEPGVPSDRRAAETLTAEAVNAALASARALAQREIAAAADELGLPIPPGMLEGLA
jgi:DNA-binding protein YbaB